MADTRTIYRVAAVNSQGKRINPKGGAFNEYCYAYFRADNPAEATRKAREKWGWRRCEAEVSPFHHPEHYKTKGQHDAKLTTMFNRRMFG